MGRSVRWLRTGLLERFHPPAGKILKCPGPGFDEAYGDTCVGLQPGKLVRLKYIPKQTYILGQTQATLVAAGRRAVASLTVIRSRMSVDASDLDPQHGNMTGVPGRRRSARTSP
jgi:hypothetical protein